jgi:protein TonB
MRKQEGWVTIEFKVRPDGSVAETAVVAAEPEGVFDRTALRAIDKWRFDPACADGYPTESAERYTLRFRLGQ